MISRPCLVPKCLRMAVGGPRGARCRPCQQAYDRQRNAQPVRAVYRDPAYLAAVRFGICHLCGEPGADTRDHFIPVSKGGTNHPSNLRPAHRACNSAKRDRVDE